MAAGKPVKFGTCSAQVLAFFLDSHTPNYDLEDKKQLIWDMAEAMNRELRQLAAAGCKVIQVEEPTLHFMARYNPGQKELLDFLVKAFNREVEGLEDVEVWIHTCWGNPNMQKVFTDESYANSVEIYLERLKGDVWTIEATENDSKELPLFANRSTSPLACDAGQGPSRGRAPPRCTRAGRWRDWVVVPGPITWDADAAKCQ